MIKIYKRNSNIEFIVDEITEVKLLNYQIWLCVLYVGRYQQRRACEMRVPIHLSTQLCKQVDIKSFRRTDILTNVCIE